MIAKPLGAKDALILVDVQRDFCPGGALPVPDGQAVVEPLNAWIARARQGAALVVASRDWHPRGHPSFKDAGGPWPTHCLQDTPGARFAAGLKLPRSVVLVSKGVRFDKDQYSTFDDTGLAQMLGKRGVRRVWIGGLALDICVRATALDALRAGFETHIILESCRALTAQGQETALNELRAAGAIVEEAVTPGL